MPPHPALFAQEEWNLSQQVESGPPPVSETRSSPWLHLVDRNLSQQEQSNLSLDEQTMLLRLRAGDAAA
jgi:hypothetical protein